MDNLKTVFYAGSLVLVAVLVPCATVRADQSPLEVMVLTPHPKGTPLTSLDVVACDTIAPKQLTVNDTSLQSKLNDLGLQKGDRLSVTVDKDHQDVLQTATLAARSVSPGRVAGALSISALALFLVCLLLSWGHPLQLVIGEDGRYSNSKFQTALWFGILVTTYLATVWLRASQVQFLGGVNIPTNLLLLSGMSTLTFGAAKGITTTKIQNAIAAGNPAPKRSASRPHFLSDLAHNDTNQLDLGDFQMLVVTLLAVAVYLTLTFHFLGSLEMRSTVSLPDVDTTILAAFGLGQGAYLTKKAVGTVGQT